MKRVLKIFLLIGLISLYLFQMQSVIIGFKPVVSFSHHSVQHSHLLQSSLDERRDHSIIFIDGNDDFIDQATSEGWEGDGTPSKPVIITGLSILSAPDPLIYIYQTDLHFQIIDCLLMNGGGDGIVLDNVKNAFIFNNTVYNNGGYGIFLFNVTNVIVSYNEVNGQSGNGIHILRAIDLTISDNEVFDNKVGIRS